MELKPIEQTQRWPEFGTHRRELIAFEPVQRSRLRRVGVESDVEPDRSEHRGHAQSCAWSDAQRSQRNISALGHHSRVHEQRTEQLYTEEPHRKASLEVAYGHERAARRGRLN